MNGLSLGPLSISILCVYVGFQHFWFYRKVPAQRDNLYFSFTAAIILVYSFSAAMLYQTLDPRQGVFWSRLEVASAILFCPTFLYFIASYLGLEQGRFHRFLFIVAVLAIPLVLFTPLMVTNEVVPFRVPWAGITIQEGQSGAASPLFTLWVLGLMLYGTALLVRGHRQGRGWVRPLTWACGVFFLLCLHDLLVFLRLIPSFYTAEYGFLIILIGITITLSNRFFQVHRRVEDLNRSLREKTAQIQASERRFRGLFEGAKDGIFLFDRQGTIRMANPYLRDLVGLPAAGEDLPGVRELFGEDWEEVERAMRLLAEGAEDRVDLEAQVRPGGTSPRSVSLGISLLDTGEEGDLYQGIARDMTDYKAWMKRVFHQDKMASMGVLAGGVAHEFSNILTSISGFAQMAARSRSPEEMGRALEVIMEQSERATEVARCLLRFSGSVQLDQKREVSPKELLDQSLTLVEREMQKNGIWIVRDYRAAPVLRTDPASLEQLLVNLYLNARDAMEAGGTLIVRAQEQPDRCLIEVEDDGPGVPPGDLQRIFEPFYTTKGALGRSGQKGMGLGLAVSHGIAEELGGEIHADNLPSHGTRFTVVLQRA